MRLNNYKSFKALGIMLCYPNPEWIDSTNELCLVMENEKLLELKDIERIKQFINVVKSKDLIDVQEEYVELFDRTRSLSLHLFEHVHGESRERGQAMVDLAEIYMESGFIIAENELPDYLPAFLEYLSYLSKDEAIETLKEPIKIIKAIGKRLSERKSDYGVIFNSLIRITGEEPDKVTEKVIPRPSYEQIDKEWEEKPVTFLGADNPVSTNSGGCGSCSGCSSSHKEKSQLNQPTCS